jgi:hypothetical protein
MELLGDMGHMESHLFLFGDSISVSARLVHDLLQMYHRLRNRFGCTQWYSKVMSSSESLVLVHVEIRVILMQDRCIVCVKHAIGTDIVMDSLDGTHR